jgi:dTDP-4-dehydrorhamnose 3,5-epimerase-like enzyme
MDFKSGKAFDDRGSVTYHNDFPTGGMWTKRFYIVENFRPMTIRAWHGHAHETKFVTCVEGAAVVCWIGFLENFENPSKADKRKKPFRQILTAEQPRIMELGHAGYNGAMSLLPGTKLLYFSNRTLEESEEDDYRLHWAYFGDEVWRVESR